MRATPHRSRGSCLVADDVVEELAGGEDEPARVRAVVSASSITRRRRTSLSSSSELIAARRRNSPFGVITMSGRADGRAPGGERMERLRGSRRIDDPNVSCAASWRNRSRRALECSGPFPSYPCGRAASAAMSGSTSKAGDDELVDRDLSAVHEVTELRLPEHERLRRGNRVAVLEADCRVLGERRVEHLE